ncbi:MAG: hypothetical protein COZ46_01545 [Verrucomicrobia bacterium CG_4_10_14_3_um_filter_43_23]|nr:MAG: hypothetical protein AUJ82_01565 [Verrucomicrobia bacterium CG1_02_43_26]PIP59584.1 MAG: hypothetical protein COX01_03150 [Verrucomicrobia bacterium CG22_combo_CG10-13_8_21_14_all_43_17]PIX58883.1 MAG: hypothetical protein COZ46_01545 [Verrucomicrobia bacterium CG_4_10_14_3_um_filter_43_23]PIY61659.1 MAG: hypothetical protein COY94_04130 [Verrucomicrobia bacterium CG_4_10_14_0_8_um_filter_43_34]PJA44543.1 MAG: hypothetical protein CO175_02200 [Verrucomicrobia bacterium CG_4_9_14_3_um_fi
MKKFKNAALIGFTGFVGSNLREQFRFDGEFNSANIASLKDSTYHTVICAGIPAKKWIANQHPEEDRKNIEALAEHLKGASIKRFVLISTIDVYPSPIDFNEDFDPSEEENHPYGVNRIWFENFIKQTFPIHYIIRLPGLFGNYLKKNVLFDLLNDNCLEQINPDSSFQYYYLKNLKSDIAKMIDNDIRVINFATEPIKTSAIIERFFKDKAVGQKKSNTSLYAFRSKYDRLWNGQHGYLYNADQIMRELGEFVATNRAKR